MNMVEDPGTARREVEEARAQLGQTVEALAYKANAPRRAAQRIRRAPWVRIGAAAVAVGLVAAGVAVALHRNGY
jgi:ElaB/YqjD/DUF883 family membrane-anchored ribosome-binding protein